VTGPPIDPRIVACNQTKKIWTKDRPLKICLTTGGLGTNKPENKRILEQLLPVLKQQALGQKMIWFLLNWCFMLVLTKTIWIWPLKLLSKQIGLSNYQPQRSGAFQDECQIKR
jgi:hypothetical protein